jgi:uncharacterized protein (TIGR03435 family)
VARRRLIASAGLFLLAPLSRPQDPPASPRFEVASVRVHAGDLHSIYDYSSSGPRATWIAYPVAGLIMEAYNLKDYQLSFAASVRPGYNTYYDVVAKSEGDAPRTRDEFRRMLQALLEERFKIQVHRERKEVPGYALVVGRKGPKFKESAPDAEPAFHGDVNGRNQGVTASKYTMQRLADGLAVYLDSAHPAVVVDRTGLTGVYDIKFEATPAFRIARDPQLGDLSIFTALEEQLGLSLEPERVQIEILMTDRIEKPTGN